MSSPQQILRSLRMRPRRTWGQNFLVQDAAAERILAWANPEPQSTVVEIGPGLGALTKVLKTVAQRVISIEIDLKLQAYLRKQFGQESWFTLVPGDALEIDYQQLLKNEASPIYLISNLPYRISTPVLERLLLVRFLFAEMVFLLQKEVVERIQAKPGGSDYGRLSIFIQTFCDVEAGPIFSKGNFHPVPDVDSQMIRLRPLAKPRVSELEQEFFFSIVKLLFQHRRKTTRSCLRLAKRDWNFEQALEQSKISGDRRPETLSIEELLLLVNTLKNQA